MKKILEKLITGVMCICLGLCLFYCMVAGARKDESAAGYVCIVGVLAASICAALYGGFWHIRKLQEKLEQLEEEKDTIRKNNQKKN